MKRYITEIQVNRLFHLSGFSIPISDDLYPHLIVTGRNGSGKTVLLNAIADFLDIVKHDRSLNFLKYHKRLENGKRMQQRAKTSEERMYWRQNNESYEEWIEELYGKVNLIFGDIETMVTDYQKGDFIITLYKADRKSRMMEPKNPVRPDCKIKGDSRATLTDQFLNFLSDLKIQEALARNEKQLEDADRISAWFVGFEELLRQIYQDKELVLEFNYKDYSFRINTNGKSFKFTEMSDGFAATLDIVADLILKMQNGDSPVRVYEKKGIVLIDEIETHLHLELQKAIMPLLTKVFPNIQFIVTTHSPFVLSSMNDAVAFDLEHREIINDLTDYSYESLAEGYFGVRTDSSYAEMQLDRLEVLLSQSAPLSASDAAAAKHILQDFNRIPESMSPLLVGRYGQLKVKFADKIKSL